MRQTFNPHERPVAGARASRTRHRKGTGRPAIPRRRHRHCGSGSGFGRCRRRSGRCCDSTAHSGRGSTRRSDWTTSGPRRCAVDPSVASVSIGTTVSGRSARRRTSSDRCVSAPSAANAVPWAGRTGAPRCGREGPAASSASVHRTWGVARSGPGRKGTGGVRRNEADGHCPRRTPHGCASDCGCRSRRIRRAYGCQSGSRSIGPGTHPGRIGIGATGPSECETSVRPGPARCSGGPHASTIGSGRSVSSAGCEWNGPRRSSDQSGRCAPASCRHCRSTSGRRCGRRPGGPYGPIRAQSLSPAVGGSGRTRAG